MPQSLNILVVEDSPDDADLLVHELRRAGFNPQWQRVETERDFLAELKKLPDIILSDYSMPEFSGLRAAKLAQESGLDIPFILISGTVGEDVAVEAMKQGATDYLLKDRLGRLGQAVRRALGEKRLRAERKRTEEGLRLLSSAVEQSKESIVITDADLDMPGPRILFCNPAFTEMTGYTAEEAIGKTPRILQGLRTDKAVLQRLRKNLKCGEVFKGEAIQYRKDGQEYFQEWHITPLRNAAGTITHFVSIQRDITKHKRAEEEVRWKTAFLEAQVDSALDGILVVDSQQKRILQNKRLVELFRLPKQIAEDADDSKLLRHVTGQMKNPTQFLERVEHLYTHPDEIGRDEVELASGTILDRYSAPVRDKAGTYYGRIWSFRDITDRRKLEAQLRQSQKMEAIGQLASGVAHDFNNILAVIQLQAGLLKAEATLTADQLEYAGEIEQAAQRAANLTRQLLLFSRKQSLQSSNLNLNDIISNITKMLHRVLGEDIQMQLKYAPQPMMINADASMMDQILLNLTVNARDAMPRGGQLIVETSAVDFDELAKANTPQARPGSFVRLSVSDSGCGIPPENLPKIFDPFFTTKEVGKGTGLGLATVFGIVQQHQGWINVYSEVGKGTTFRIYLPRLAKSADKKAIWPSLASVRGGSETILLVEDEAALRSSVRIALSRLGYRVLEAATGVEALEVWRQNQETIHLLLTDMIMPGGMNGKELAQQLRSENPKLKVIYASGYSADIAGQELGLQDGVNFLTKPFEAHKLAQTVRNCLDEAKPTV